MPSRLIYQENSNDGVHSKNTEIYPKLEQNLGFSLRFPVVIWRPVTNSTKDLLVDASSIWP